MSRMRYWLCATIPLAIALTQAVRAEGPNIVLTSAVRPQGTLVSLEATDVTLPALARLMSEALGCEVRIEGQAAGTVTLDLKDVAPARLLAETATALGGRWQPVYRLSTREQASPPPVPSGVVLKLNLPDLSCHTAASVVARMAGGRIERDGELSGQVSLVADNMPVETAMDAIAQAANATWRRTYVMRVDALPQTLVARKPEVKPKNADQKPRAKPKPGPKLFSSHQSLTGQPTKFARRDRFNTQKSYAPGVRPPTQASLEQLEKHAMLGMYANFFMFDSDAGREAAMTKFMSGLQAQLKRLEALPANQRVVTTMMTRRSFERLIADYANLDKEQKEATQKVYEFAREQLERPPLKQ